MTNIVFESEFRDRSALLKEELKKKCKVQITYFFDKNLGEVKINGLKDEKLSSKYTKNELDECDIFDIYGIGRSIFFFTQDRLEIFGFE